MPTLYEARLLLSDLSCAARQCGEVSFLSGACMVCAAGALFASVWVMGGGA